VRDAFYNCRKEPQKYARVYLQMDPTYPTYRVWTYDFIDTLITNCHIFLHISLAEMFIRHDYLRFNTMTSRDHR